MAMMEEFDSYEIEEGTKEETLSLWDEKSFASEKENMEWTPEWDEYEWVLDEVETSQEQERISIEEESQQEQLELRSEVLDSSLANEKEYEDYQNLSQEAYAKKYIEDKRMKEHNQSSVA